MQPPASPVRTPRRRDGGLRLGIVGFGRLAQRYYAPALPRLDGVGAIVVADPLPASRSAAARALGNAAVVAEVAELLAADPDAVVVATPPSTHLALWNALAARGVPVLMEKPFVLRGELTRAARGDGVEPLLMIDFNRRFWPPYARLAARARDGAIGTVRAVEIALHVDVAPWCTVTSHRLATGEGGVLYDLGSQALYLVHAITGDEPTRIAARAASRRWTCDHVQLELELTSGAHVVCDLAYDARTYERVSVRGSTGTLAIADPNMRLHRRNGATAGVAARAADLGTFAYHALFRARSMARASIAAALQQFVAAVASGAAFTPGFDEAVQTTEWLERVHVEVAS